MAILETVFNETKGVFGKSYLLAGVLPAGLILIVWKWFTLGLSGLSSFIKNLFNLDKGFIETSSLFILCLLGIGLIFFAARKLFLSFFQTLPSDILFPLKYFLIKLKLKKSRRLLREKDALLRQYTALRWYEKDFASHTYESYGLEVINIETVIAKSEEARKQVMFCYEQTPDYLSKKELNNITDGLCKLYNFYPTYSKTTNEKEKDKENKKKSKKEKEKEIEIENKKYLNELNEWKKLVNDKRAKKILKLSGIYIYYKYLNILQKIKTKPEDDRWLQPTDLGNYSAALDDYASKRYGIDTNTLWSRLFGILSAEEKKEVVNAQLSIETLINISVTGVFFCLLILVTANYNTPSINWRKIEFFISSLIISIIAYQSTIYSFQSLTEKVMRLIDLNRLKLLVSLGYESPKTISEEIKAFEELKLFFVHAIPRDSSRKLQEVKYSPEKSGAEEKKEESKPDSKTLTTKSDSD